MCDEEEEPCKDAITMLKADPVNSEAEWQVKPIEKQPAPKYTVCSETDA